MLRRPCAVLLLALAACGTSSPSQGAASTSCSTDGDCAAELACLAFATFGPDGGCSEGARACSTPCSTDVDCAALGAKYKCFAGCGSVKFCGATP